MKRLQISIEEDLDEALGRLAGEKKTSKAALIRDLVRKNVEALPSFEQDPIWAMSGADEFEPAGHDEVVYGPASAR